MDREIEFRGKTINTEEWVYGNLIISNDVVEGYKNIIVYQQDSGMYADESVTTGAYSNLGFKKWDKVIPETVGQYTGLKDMNAKKIYEGDVLKTTNAYRNDWSVFVSFDRGMFLGKVKQTHKGTALYQWDLTHYEIVGNIHNNPELLGAN